MVKGLPAEWGMCFRTVLLDNCPLALACWKDTIAIGSQSPDIIIFDAITGSQVAILSGHTDQVNFLAFSPDGMIFVSGGDDTTVKLWDMQTGGVVKIFFGHTSWVTSVSISADCTMIASGSYDKAIHLWDIQTGGCHCVIGQSAKVTCVVFSPSNPCYLISVSQDGTIQQWDTNGHQTGPKYEGSHVVFSLDGTCFVLWGERVGTVRNSDSGVIVAQFHIDNNNIYDCCFSPNGKLMAVAAGSTIYIWDITGSDPHIIKTFIGHADFVNSLAFSSSLISLSSDKSMRFWQVGTLSTDLAVTAIKPMPPTSASIKSITLQAKNGIVISCDLDGVVVIVIVFCEYLTR